MSSVQVIYLVQYLLHHARLIHRSKFTDIRDVQRTTTAEDNSYLNNVQLRPVQEDRDAGPHAKRGRTSDHDKQRVDSRWRQERSGHNHGCRHCKPGVNSHVNFDNKASPP